MKKTKMFVLVGAAVLSVSAFARPGGPRIHRPAPRPVVVHHHHSGGSFWGRGGRNFWPGFVGGVVGGIVGGVAVDTVVAPRTTIVTTPTVVTPAPVVVTPAPVVTVAPTVVAAPAPVTTIQNVWVEGRYVDQIQPNGSTVRIWQPGHYEQRTVTVQ